MKRAFRYLLPLLLLMLLTLPALADGYEFADDLTGEYLYPAGSATAIRNWPATTKSLRCSTQPMPTPPTTPLPLKRR